MVPNFIGIGAPKAGTTWLSLCLKEHPQVFVAERKETNFFDYQTIESRMPEYEAHFADSSGFAAIGEISTRYLTSTRAPERIRAIIPDARLFVSLRNPIDQVYSHYWHLLRQNFHEWDHRRLPGSFEEALQSYEDKLLRPAFYYQHLQPWLSRFERAQLLVIFYDDIRAQPRQVLKTLYRFLEVDSDFEPRSVGETGAAARRGTSPRSLRLGRIQASLYNHLNRRLYYPFKKLVGIRTAEQIKNMFKVREILEAIFQRKGYPPMQPETRAALRRRFDEDIRGLMELTGRDLSHWR
jgi:Sulfotransferase domain